MIKKNIAVFLTMLAIAVQVTGCSREVSTNPIEPAEPVAEQTQEEQIREESSDNLQATLLEIKETYSDYKKVAEKYGQYEVKTQLDDDLLDSHYSYVDKSDGKTYASVDYDMGYYYVNIDNTFYGIDKRGEEVTYTQFVNNDDESVRMSELENYQYLGKWYYEEVSDDSRIVKTDDGYTIEYSYDSTEENIGEYSCNVIVSVNEDLSIRDIKCEYYNADGHIATEVSVFNYKAETPDYVAEITDRIAQANNETRKVTYHIVENGEVIDTYVSEVLKGFFVVTLLPSRYVYEIFEVFNDVECTQLSTNNDAYVDSEVYVMSDIEREHRSSGK